MTITLMIATVTVEPGWAVGALTVSDPAIDRDILLDAAGRPWVPGSALAGSLRAHLSQAAPPDGDVRLMGSRPPRNQAEAAESTVSPLWIVGSIFAPDGAGDQGREPAALEISGQTAIDRERGAAAAGPLRFSRLAARGGTLTVYLRHDTADGTPLGDHDLQLIAAWPSAIGRDRTKGCGRATLTQLRYGQVDPATPVGASTWLTHTGPDLFEAVATRTITCEAVGQEPWLEAGFEITDGLVTSDGLPAKVARSRQRLGRPVIPGSTWKGIIRSRAEYIIRSRYGEQAACQDPAACGTCPTCQLFGHPGQRARLAFRDSYIDNPQDTSPPVRTHVGIDRVSGGARDALLFQTAPLAAGQLRLQIDALGDVVPWVRNLISHVLRDIDDGLIGVGSRTTRGLGTLRLTSQPEHLEPVHVPALGAATPTEPAR
jgi:CRISPR/Cas system CSM-associated protein Csm3 (group 7 of RAMP superfamily)